MKFDRGLLKTVLFSLGVVSFVIGVYQTVTSGNLPANYWIFMVSMGCWLPLRYWRQKEAAAAKAAPAVLPTPPRVAKAGPPSQRGKPARKRR